MKKILTIFVLFALAFSSSAQSVINQASTTAITGSAVDDCPEPTESQITCVCNSIYDKKAPTINKPIVGAKGGYGFGYKYQEDLWQMSCAVPGIDTEEESIKKIQAMWMKCRVKFRCYKYIGVSVSDGNVAKFAMDTGLSTFLVTAVKRYKLDMNFIDPADGKTIMDFLDEQFKMFKKADSLDKAEECLRLYKLLEKHGCKHAKDL